MKYASVQTRLVLSGIIALVACLLMYVFIPTLAFGFGGLFIAMILVAAIAYPVSSAASIGIVAASLLYLLFGLVSSVEMGRSDSYRDLIGTKQIGIFTQDIAPIDISQIRIVDQDMAKRIGEKLLGEQESLGSSTVLGEMSIQQVKGRLYWVGPILHKGFFAWNKFGATPGYIKVSATNPNDFEFVRKIDGKDLHIRYQMGSFFADNLERHLWLNGYMSKGADDYTFEIDDEGHPFYVVTIYERKIGWSGADAVGVVVVDVESGKIDYYPADKAPAWIDRIQPEGFVHSQLAWWGEYQNGWWNPSGSGKIKPAHSPLFVHGSDGRGYWYTGISSQGKEGAISGFAMIDSRTKAFKTYQISGATEDAATKSVLGKVREKKYEAATPILYNIAGKPTYVMSLKDEAGLVKAIGMADVSDHSIVGVGDTVRDAMRSYLAAENSRGNAALADSKIKPVRISGKVDRLGQDVRSGNSFVYLTVSGYPGKAFTADSGVSPELLVTREGDMVEVEYVASSETGFIQISGFQNRTLTIKKGDGQIALETATESVQMQKAQKADAREANVKWEQLSDDQKSKMLDSLKKG